MTDLVSILSTDDKEELYKILRQKFLDKIDDEKKKVGPDNIITRIEITDIDLVLYSKTGFRGFIKFDAFNDEEIYDWLYKFEFDDTLNINPENLKNSFRVFKIFGGFSYYPNYKDKGPLKLVRGEKN
jgi:hypothetical protein